MGVRSKLRPRQWEIIARRVEAGESVRQIAKDFGISESAIRKQRDKQLGIADQAAERTSFCATERSGYVYVMRVLDSVGLAFYKIGLTTDVDKRLAAHQVSLPFDLKLVCSYYVANMFLEEKTLHGMFKSKWVRGEWFSLSDDDVKTIACRNILE